MTDNFYYVPCIYGGFQVNSRAQGDRRVAFFPCEKEGKDYAKYRNEMLEKYDTSDVSVYKHKE